MKYLLHYCLVLVIALGCFSRCHAQCASQYSNTAPDGAGNVHAWTVMTDNYTNPGSGCAPGNWPGGFTHTYHVSIGITSPSGRSASGTSYGSGQGGGGTVATRSDAYLPINGESGSFTLTGLDTITCSIAGLFFTGTIWGSFTPPPPTINGVSDSATGSTTIYNGATGYLAIYGSALTAWGEDPNPTVTGDSGVTLGTYWPSDTQVNASYAVTSDAAPGQHTLALQTRRGRAQGQFNVECPYPRSEHSYNGQWCAGCTVASFIVQLLDAGGMTPANGKYQGRTVTEVNSNADDGCWFQGSTKEPSTALEGGSSWPVYSNNNYGADQIVDDPVWVAYYQNLIAKGLHIYPRNTCSQTDTQALSISACRAGDSGDLYETHTCAIIIGPSLVTAVRGDASVSGAGPPHN